MEGLRFEQDEKEKTRELYERLVKPNGHVRVRHSYAEFEAAPIPLSQAVREDKDDKMVEGSVALDKKKQGKVDEEGDDRDALRSRTTPAGGSTTRGVSSSRDQRLRVPGLQALRRPLL